MCSTDQHQIQATASARRRGGASAAKPAVPFGGAYRIIDFTLSNCIHSGLRRIHDNLCYALTRLRPKRERLPEQEEALEEVVQYLLGAKETSTSAEVSGGSSVPSG